MTVRTPFRLGLSLTLCHPLAVQRAYNIGVAGGAEGRFEGDFFYIAQRFHLVYTAATNDANPYLVHAFPFCR